MLITRHCNQECTRLLRHQFGCIDRHYEEVLRRRVSGTARRHFVGAAKSGSRSRPTRCHLDLGAGPRPAIYGHAAPDKNSEMRSVV